MTEIMLLKAKTAYLSDKRAYMVIFWVILGLILGSFVLLLLWVLFAPLLIFAETEGETYYLEVKKLIRIKYLPESQNLEAEVHFLPLGWRRTVTFGSDAKRKSAQEPEKKATKQISIRKLPFRKMAAIAEHAFLDLIASFKVKQFRWDLDTSDFTLNAQILPVFTILHYTKRLDCRINFEGRNALLLEMENRLSRLMIIGLQAAYQLFKLKKKKHGIEH